jgi:hypothetical protein
MKRVLKDQSVFFFADFDVFQNSFQRLFIDDWPDGCSSGFSKANFQAASRGDQSFHEGRIDAS